MFLAKCEGQLISPSIYYDALEITLEFNLVTFYSCQASVIFTCFDIPQIAEDITTQRASEYASVCGVSGLCGWGGKGRTG